MVSLVYFCCFPSLLRNTERGREKTLIWFVAWDEERAQYEFNQDLVVVDAHLSDGGIWLG